MNINCSESITINDNANIQFIKSYHISIPPNNKYMVLSIKCIDNIIYIYQIDNKVNTLLHLHNIARNKPVNYEYICKNIKINNKWNKLSLLDGDTLCIYDIHSLIGGKIVNNYIKLNNTKDTDTLIDMYLYNYKVLRTYGNKNKNRNESIVTLIEILHTDSDKNISVVLDNVVIQNIVISNNGDFMMYPTNKDCMCIYSLKDLTKFTLRCDNGSYNSKWLLSDDGNVIVRKIEHILDVIILDKEKGKVYTPVNLDTSEYSDKNSVMLATTRIGENVMNTILLWDRLDYTFYLWGVVNYNGNHISISNRIQIKPHTSDIPLKTSTNGKLFVNIYKDRVDIIDITYLIPFPCIIQCCEIIYAKIKKQTTPVLSNNMLIGNMTSLKNQRLTEKLIYILDPLVADNKIIMETHDTLTVPIIEKSNNTYNNSNIIHTYTDLDSVDLFFTILHNTSTTLSIFNSLRNDELYNVKVNMFFSLLADILSSLLKDNTSDSVYYCQLCMLCTILMYKYTDRSYDQNVIDKLKTITNNIQIDSY